MGKITLSLLVIAVFFINGKITTLDPAHPEVTAIALSERFVQA